MSDELDDHRRETMSIFVYKYLDHRVTPVARKYAASYGLPRSAVEDIVGEALARVWAGQWHRLFELCDERRLSAVFATMLNVAREERRKSAPWTPHSDPPEVRVQTRIDEQLLAKEALARLKPALESLSDDQRKVIELVAFAGMARPDIAVELGLTETNVSTLLNRARLSLRKALGDEFVEACGLTKRRHKRAGEPS